MAQPQTVYPITAFNKSKTGKDRGALAKRFDHSVFIDVDLKTLPPDVLRDLLLEALQNKARAAVKKLNAEAATEAEIQAAMQAAVDRVKSGKGVGGKAKPKMDEETKAIRAEARSILREQIKAKLEASDAAESLTGKQITSKISEYFKARDAYHRNPTKNAEHKGRAAVVDRVMAQAAERIKQRQEAEDDLGPMLEEMQNAPKEEAPKATKPKANGQAKKAKGQKPASAPAA